MTVGRTLLFLVIGAVAWYLAALLIRFYGDVLLTGGWEHRATVAVAALAAPLVTWLVARATGTPPHAMTHPMALMVMIAVLLDGLAVTWAPELYGGPGPTLSYGAAFLLWGVGCLLLSALVWPSDGPS